MSIIRDVQFIQIKENIMKLKQKITALAIISVTVIFFAVGIPLYLGLKTTGKDSAKDLKKVMLSNFKKGLQQQTQQAISGIKSIHKLQLQGKISETEAKKRALHLVKNLKYGKVGYFWITDTGRPYPKIVMHAISPQLIGKVLIGPKFNCALGKKENLFKAMVDICLKKGSGFVDYQLDNWDW